MRNFSILLLASLMLITGACNDEKDPEAKDLQEVESKLKEKKQEVAELQKEIDELEVQRLRLDPSLVNHKPVKVDTITYSSFTSYFEAQGVAETRENIIVSSETNGALTNIAVVEGQKVNKGQVLANIDADILQQNIQELKVQLDLAKTTFERQSNLWDQNIGSEFQYLEAKNRKESLEKRLNSLYAQLSKSVIRAPISGTVDAVFVKQGETVMPGSRIARVVNLEKMQLKADVSESRLGTIKKGDTVSVSFSSLPGYEQKAVVAAVGQVINPNNRTFQVEVSLSNEDRLIKPNLLGTIKVQDYYSEQSVVIAQDLVQQDRQGNEFIYLADKTEDDMVANKTIIETGKNYKGRVEVTSGLKPGDIIITTGSKEVSDREQIALR